MLCRIATQFLGVVEPNAVVFLGNVCLGAMRARVSPSAEMPLAVPSTAIAGTVKSPAAGVESSTSPSLVEIAHDQRLLAGGESRRTGSIRPRRRRPRRRPGRPAPADRRPPRRAPWRSRRTTAAIRMGLRWLLIRAPFGLLDERRKYEDAARAGGPNTFRSVRIFSGIQPTGRKHLGNYIGAISQYVESQERGEGIFCLVDLHAISVAYEPAELRERLYDTTAILLAAGLDPERCILFRQSDVHEHTELCWLLSAVTAHGDLNRMTQFKDKAAKAARACLRPPCSSTRCSKRRTCSPTAPTRSRSATTSASTSSSCARSRGASTSASARPWSSPSTAFPRSARASWTSRTRPRRCPRRAASEAGTVLVLDEPNRITKKIKSAVTDSGSGVHRGEGKEGVANLIDILAAVRGSTPDAVESEFEGSGYGDFKGAVAEAVVEYLAPVQERYAELRSDEAELERMLAAGADKAREIAAGTLADVRQVMGVGPTGR